ncbi:WxL protein peptidoglycan domain-containing protein [Agromyces cerinus]|uniref:DUF916 domain-containing protein n=1 Tax=Agromyces cerinus subsp. cerinus TaxID=232089 RepID=A0A1N6GUW7_9MICO|nr:DUF916 domain-containing protein [Agromyces cerinus]SIO11364.1 protein of unknown function [Agromyces cerinus subsp. cerinus]
MNTSRLMLAALAVIGLTGLAAPSVATAAEGESESAVTWAMSPADASGPDGRSWAELELDPGERITEHLAVRNFGDRDVTFTISAADGYFTPTGRFNMLPSDAESVDAGTWISVDDQVTVAPGGTAVLPFTVEVPDDATPGDHAAGIAASIYTESSGDGAGLGVESRVGFRVMTRVTGTIQPGLEVTPAPEYITSWNPFEPGNVELAYLLENTGNVRLTVTGSVEHGGTTYPAADSEQAQPIELLPGDRRTLSILVPDVWPTVFTSLPLTITQSVVAPDGEASQLEPVELDVAVWAIPWPQLVVVVALGLMIAGLFWGRRRRTKQIEHLVDEAREAGRREAEQSTRPDIADDAVPESQR